MFMMAHSAIWGPWIPVEFVMMIELEVYIGLETRRSMPAEQICTHFRLLRCRETALGMLFRKGKVVDRGDGEGLWRRGGLT